MVKNAQVLNVSSYWKLISRSESRKQNTTMYCTVTRFISFRFMRQTWAGWRIMTKALITDSISLSTEPVPSPPLAVHEYVSLFSHYGAVYSGLGHSIDQGLWSPVHSAPKRLCHEGDSTSRHVPWATIIYAARVEKEQCGSPKLKTSPLGYSLSPHARGDTRRNAEDLMKLVNAEIYERAAILKHHWFVLPRAVQ